MSTENKSTSSPGGEAIELSVLEELVEEVLALTLRRCRMVVGGPRRGESPCCECSRSETGWPDPVREKT